MTEDTKADRLIVYVDGFNLYHGLRNESHREHLWLDVVALAKELRPRSQIVRVYYFTALSWMIPMLEVDKRTIFTRCRPVTPGLLKLLWGDTNAKRKTV